MEFIKKTTQLEARRQRVWVWVIILLGVILAVLPQISAYQCYQETANTSLSCLGNLKTNGSLGKYYLWQEGVATQPNHWTINYTVPNNVTNVTLRIKTEAWGEEYLRVPKGCWNTTIPIISLVLLTYTSNTTAVGAPYTTLYINCRNHTSPTNNLVAIRPASENASNCLYTPNDNLGLKLYDGDWSTKAIVTRGTSGTLSFTEDPSPTVCSKHQLYEEGILWDINETFEGTINETAYYYSTTIGENESQQISVNTYFNVTNFQYVNAYLIYNNTLYNTINSSVGTNQLIFNTTLTTPLVPFTRNIAFYWVYNVSNGTNIITFTGNSQSQQVTKLSPMVISYGCPVGYNVFRTFQFEDEENFNNMTVNVTYNIQYGYGSSFSSYLAGNVMARNLSICTNTTNFNYTLTYGEIQYSASSYVNKRYYLFTNTLTNTTDFIESYNLPESLSTTFKLVIKDTSQTPADNVYVALLRWYPSYNEYKIVDMGITDTNGETLTHVRTVDVDYRIAVYRSDGTLLQLFNPQRFSCNPSLTDTCTATYTISGVIVPYSSWLNMQNSLTFNSTSKRFTYYWSDSTQTTQSMNLVVYKDTGYSTLVVCNQTTSNYLGVMTCDASAQTGTLRAVVRRTGSPEQIINQMIATIGQGINQFNNKVGLYVAMIITMALALIGAMVSPAVMIIFACASLVIALVLGSINWIVFTAIIALGIIIIHFSRRVG